MKNIKVYLCESTIDCIFTGIYNAWESKYGHNNIKIVEQENFENMELFTEYIKVVADSEKASKVATSIQKKISTEAYLLVCSSALSNKVGRADAIYRFLLLGFSVGKDITNQMNHPMVYPLFTMERFVHNEAHHYLGFLRFSQLKNGILFSRIRPKNDIITLIADHFSQRLMNENWLIYDAGRKTAVIHRKSSSWFFTDARDLDLSILEDYSQMEESIQSLWKQFVDIIGIKERSNSKLQYQMLPNRYREFMREI